MSSLTDCIKWFYWKVSLFMMTIISWLIVQEAQELNHIYEGRIFIRHNFHWLILIIFVTALMRIRNFCLKEKYPYAPFHAPCTRSLHYGYLFSCWYRRNPMLCNLHTSLCFFFSWQTTLASKFAVLLLLSKVFLQ